MFHAFLLSVENLPDSLQAMQANVWRRFFVWVDLPKMEVSSLAGLILNK